MDLEELREEAEEWVAEGIVTPEQADAILARYGGERGDRYDGDAGRAADDGRSHLVTALAVMGVVLVGAGVLWLLVDVWDGLPRAARTLVLVGAPAGFAAAGHALSRGRAPLVGHALWFLAAAVVGPAIFVLADLWSVDAAPEWLLLLWAAVALPAGHYRRSRPTTALGIVVAAATVTALESPTDLPVAAGLFGVAAFALGRRHWRRDGPDLGGTYRIVGASLAILTPLVLSLGAWSYDSAVLEPDPVVVATGLAAVAVALALGWTARRAGATPVDRVDAAWTATATAAILVAASAITLVPPLPAFGVQLLVHAALLGLLVGTAVLAAATASRALVNLTAVAIFGQVVSFLGSTLLDALSGAAALVFAGAVLLGAAVALERGRRELLERIGRRPPGPAGGTRER